MDVDVIVIGSGQAGVPLAARLAEAGRRVLLIERSHLGGTCVNYGCTPTKTLIASAAAAHEARRAPELGVEVGEVRVDMDRVADRVEAMVLEWRESVRRRLENAGDRLTLVRGHARFEGPRTVRVGEDVHTAQTLVINVGARPAVPPVEGLDRVPWLDNASLLELRRVPERLLVLGGGYIGCELGQAFRRLEAQVTIVDRNDRLLSSEDPDVSAALEAAFRNEGIALRLGVEVEAVEVVAGDEGESGSREGVRLRLSDGTGVEGSDLLVATGRRPNTDDLGLERAGIERDDQGAIVVDDGYATSVPGVYALGDAAGGPQFTHAAWDDHRILFDRLEGNRARARGDRLVAWAVFTDPQVGRVGLSETEARERGIPHEVATLPFARVARARETGRTAGQLKVLVDPATDRVLGAALVGAEAGELVHVFVALMAAGAPAPALVGAEAIHPTFAEGLHTLLMQLDRHAL